jgi:hypothetical protein
MANHKENIIREKRTLEATKKNLMGPSGKFGVILQVFGSPIIRQGSGLYDSNLLEDYNEIDDEYRYESTASGQKGPLVDKGEIDNLDFDFIQNEGVLFDGLSKGVNLEIIYWQSSNQLKVSYKGHVVYLEVAGELEGYVPFDEWENIINRLFEISKNKLKDKNIIKEKEQKEAINKNKFKFLENIKKRWGI